MTLATEQSKLPIFIRCRLLQILAAVERVGGVPVDTRSLHAFAFFANVLSPLWDIHPIDGSVLKESGAPYYPTVQREIDHLVGEGFISVVSLSKDESHELMARFRLSHARADTVLDAIRALPDEEQVEDFLTELADAFVAIRTDLRNDAAEADAAYSDPAVATGRVVDFAEWVSPTDDNPSWNTAQQFQLYAPEGFTLNRNEKLAMYMRLIGRRAHG